MPETVSAQDPSVHQHGLETGPAATLDMSGAPTEVRGLDDISGLRESVPGDDKALQSLGETDGQLRQTAQEDFGRIALDNSDVELSPSAAEELEGVSLSDSLTPWESVPPIQTPEKPEIMESVFDLARNDDVDIEKRIEAIETYVKNQEAKEDRAQPGETLDEYLARLDRVTSGQEALWSPELKYARQVLQSLKALERPEDQTANSSPTKPSAASASNSTTGTTNSAKPGLGSSQTTPSHQTAQKPNTSGAPANSSNTSTSTTTTTTGQQQSQPPGTTTQTSTPSPSPTPTPQKQQPQVPSAAPAEQAAAAQATQGGFDQAEASQSAAQVENESKYAPTTSIEPNREEYSGEKNFIDTLSQEDQTIWGDILRINEQHKDGEVSEALDALQKDFTPENAGLVMGRVERSALKRQNRGDVFGARQQKILATNLDQLAGHIFGRSINRVA
jgi:hypothetical protein